MDTDPCELKKKIHVQKTKTTRQKKTYTRAKL